MKKTIVFLFLLCLAMPAQASKFTCKPDGFTLNHLGSIWQLSGTLEVPTPGYTYKIGAATAERRDLLQLPLNLKAPAGPAPDMVDRLAITHRFTADADLLRLTVSILRDFNWGPDVIDCYIPKKPY